jgi:hypothetical protein
MNEKYLSLSFEEELYLRYAFIIPFSFAMIFLSYMTNSYLVMTMMVIDIFIVFSWLTTAKLAKRYFSNLLWKHSLRTALIILISLIASFLSLFMI